MQFTSTVCASTNRPKIGRATLLRGFPDYPKDADAALAMLAYNSSAQQRCEGSGYFKETIQYD